VIGDTRLSWAAGHSPNHAALATRKSVKMMKSLTCSRRWQGFGRAISVPDPSQRR